MNVREIIDGGLATTLIKNGYVSIDGDPLWSAKLLHTDPAAIYRAHKEFSDHGATVLITASYQASVPSMTEHLGINIDEAYRLIGKSVHLAREAANDSTKTTKESHEVCGSQSIPPRAGRSSLVAGSVGPYGACLCDGSEYTGSYLDGISEEELQAWHRPRISALTEAGCDILAIETIPALKEAEAVIRVLKEKPAMKAWISFSCQDGNAFKDPSKSNILKTAHGDDWAEAVVHLAGKYERDQLAGFGINCTRPSSIAPLLHSLETHPKFKTIDPEMKLILYPNSGESWSPDKGYYPGDDYAPYSDYCETWLRHDMRKLDTWLGGCCQVFPSDIRDLHSRIFGEGKR